MTREMNKPDWCKSKTPCDWWQSDIIGVCRLCPNYKVLDDWIKPFFDNCCRMERLK